MGISEPSDSDISISSILTDGSIKNGSEQTHDIFFLHEIYPREEILCVDNDNLIRQRKESLRNPSSSDGIDGMTSSSLKASHEELIKTKGAENLTTDLAKTSSILDLKIHNQVVPSDSRIRSRRKNSSGNLDYHQVRRRSRSRKRRSRSKKKISSTSTKTTSKTILALTSPGKSYSME